MKVNFSKKKEKEKRKSNNSTVYIKQTESFSSSFLIKEDLEMIHVIMKQEASGKIQESNLQKSQTQMSNQTDNSQTLSGKTLTQVWCNSHPK